MNTNDKLLPCPFCGGEPFTAPSGTGLVIRCGQCAARVVTDFDLSDAAKIWNRRVSASTQEQPTHDIEREAIISDLSILVTRMSRRLRDVQCAETNAAGNRWLADQAADYLQRKGLQGSPLRSGLVQQAAQPVSDSTTPWYEKNESTQAAQPAQENKDA